ncbi:protein BUNDLE SHEATH DEFECTIVE 2, chloroplastic-like [Diospyros lotus]|uniref:protein BUNDLE SHEATH DEFECTIVE 2, chloroplastic-like n=1 Tax=Diospyros lotus TaxID=55363 RepID=UPI002254D733|nr:protein BUNDLE SHEATH DEFECTIVE 2, chloroplastic-like [Diospyros lotus]
MASSFCFAPLASIKPPNKPELIPGNSTSGKVIWIDYMTQKCRNGNKFQSFEAKSTNGNQSTKANSIVCAKCDGNGAVLCSQCQGSGVNSVDHFNGRFKAGELCWLCRGKKDILCGNCNGAGFVGGFMSTFND